eukprot:1747186-Rhodomonas_salina.5
MRVPHVAQHMRRLTVAYAMPVPHAGQPACRQIAAYAMFAQIERLTQHILPHALRVTATDSPQTETETETETETARQSDRQTHDERHQEVACISDLEVCEGSRWI